MRGNMWLVFQREFLTRVHRKSFILVTLLTPLAFLLFFVVAGLIFSYQSDDKSTLLVVDEAQLVQDDQLEMRRFSLEFRKVKESELRSVIRDEGFDGGLFLPMMDSSSVGDYKYTYISDTPLDLESSGQLNRTIRQLVRNRRMKMMNVSDDVLAQLEVSSQLQQQPLNEANESLNEMTGVVAAAIGGVMGYIMFFVIIFFGTQVMRSVTEEKTNRIVEVVISSVRPFDLMLGKILGSSAVSLLQIVIWMVLIPLCSMVAQLFVPFDLTQTSGMSGGAQLPEGMENLPLILQQIESLNWWLIIPLFIFYFLAGFLIYSSLFAAIGAALGDDINEGQALTIPIVIPIVLAVYIMFQAIREPNSTLAIWSSIFPFFSSIVMPARLAYYPDWWQIGLSVVITSLTAILMIWLAGRIYRVGILSYGKKASYGEMIRWIFSKKQ